MSETCKCYNQNYNIDNIDKNLQTLTYHSFLFVHPPIGKVVFSWYNGIKRWTVES